MIQSLRFLYGVLIAGGLAFSTANAQPSTKDSNSFAYLQQQFLNPGKEYGSAPLWVWNTRVSKSIIDSVLTDFKEKAFGGVMIHPRPGLITPYLSEEWFELWTYALRKAKELDLDVWIYDENSYPSGFAGGHVQAEMPGSYNQGQMLRMSRLKLIPDSSDFFILLEKQKDGSYKTINPGTADKNKSGDYYAFHKAFYYTSAWYGGYSYVDLMVPGVTEKFLDVTMRKGYEKYVNDELGKSIKGIFSDEPNIEVWDTISVRWTPLLFSSFRQKWGYSLEEHLPSLFEETGDWRKTRHNYFSVLLQLFIDHWSKPMYEYTNSKGLEWTGHYWEHEWPSALHVPDNMAMYAWHQRPGIDMLFNQFNEQSNIAQFGNVRALRELSSVANQLNKKRTLSETYGGGGWELSFKDMKRLGDWQFVLGVNTLNQHLSYMTMEGARKYDYPQSFSYHNPWWPYYKGLNQYFARLSVALSTGKQMNNILIIEPTSSAWMYYSYTGSAKRFYKTGQEFQSFVTRLEKMQVEYDLGSENILRDHGKVNGKILWVGQASYSTIILPPGMENIDQPVFDQLKKLQDAGGRILAFDTLRYLDGKADPRLPAFMKKCIRFNGLMALDKAVISQYLPSTGIRFPGLDTSRGKLYHQRRQLTGGQLIFLVNSSLEQEAYGNMTASGKDAVLLNTEAGAITDYPDRISGNQVALEYRIAPAGSLLLFIADKPLNKPAVPVNKPALSGTKLVASKTSVERLRPNVLTLDFCDLQMKDTLLKNQYFFHAADYLFKRNGFNDGNPWNTSVQFKDQSIRRDTFAANTGFELYYYFNVDTDSKALELKAVIEKSNLWELQINGHSLSRNTNEWWLDKAFSVFSINEFIKPGRNTIRLLAPRMSVYAEVEPVYIIGNFSLVPDTLAWKIKPALPLINGSWKEQGLPLYGHEVVYRKIVEVKDKRLQYKLEPGKWKGTVAIIKVNGKQAGILMGNEKMYSISSFIQRGINTIELIITGSLKNTLGPHYYHPAAGMVSPWHWRYIYQALAAKDYDLYDYGLMNDFNIISY